MLVLGMIVFFTYLLNIKDVVAFVKKYFQEDDILFHLKGIYINLSISLMKGDKS